MIGRFYDGCDHSTVCYGIQRIAAHRENDPDVDALIADLKTQLSLGDDSPNARAKTEKCGSAITLSRSDFNQLADLIAARVCARSFGRKSQMRLIRSK